MDVNYTVSDWERTRQSIGDLIGLGVYGKGMIDDLKKLSNNLEDAESLIHSLDSDGYITFQHTSQAKNYQQLFNDFQELRTFTGQVGAIIDDVIDERFYEDIDEFVEAIQELQIGEYKTTNRIGATTAVNTYYVPSGEIPKDEVTLNDLLSGDTFYADQLKLEYEHVKEMNPDQEFSVEEYQQVVLNTHAFEYTTIKDQQFNKEFWVNIGALVVIVGTAIICPPAGLALGAVYGTLELSSSVSGKDWVSGRELDDGERAFRGVLAPLDIVPGVGAVKKFAILGRISHLQTAADLGIATTRTGATVRQTIGNSIHSAKSSGSRRVQQAKEFVSARTRDVGKKLEGDLIETGRIIDKGVTGAKRFGDNLTNQPHLATAGGPGIGRNAAENTHKIENFFRSKIDNVTSGSGNKIDGLDIVDGKIGGKIPVEDFQEIRKVSIQNPDAEAMVLGKYSDGGKSYISEAQKGNSTYFDLGDNWGEIQKRYQLTNDEMFEYFNVPALDDAVKNGKQISFSHDPTLNKYERSFLDQEWNYLKEKHGYVDLIEKGGLWHAVK